MYDPTEYVVIDFRVLRALGAVDPQIADPKYWSEFRQFTEHFRSYGDSPDTYRFYMDKVEKSQATMTSHGGKWI